MRNINQLSSSLLLIGLGFCQCVGAQGRTDTVTQIDLEPEIISASRSLKTQAEIPNMITIIDAEAIENALMIDDTLTGVLELTVPEFSPGSSNATDRGVTIRGRNPLYMVDGIPMFNPLFDGRRDAFSIDMDFVEKIEVIHGGNATNGSGALGGAINMITQSGSEKEGFSGEFKSSLDFDSGLEFDGLHKKYSGVFSYNSGSGWSTTLGYARHLRGLNYDANDDPQGFFRYQGNTADSTSDNIFFKTTYDDEGQKLQLMINKYTMAGHGEYNAVPGDRTTGQYTSVSWGAYDVSLYGEPAENDLTSVSLDYIKEDLGSWRLVSQVYYNDFSIQYEGWTSNDQSTQNLNTSERKAWKTSLSKDISVKSNLSFGLDLSNDESSQKRVPSGAYQFKDINLSEVSPFARLDFDLNERTLLTGGLRYENTKLDLPNYTNTHNISIAEDSASFDELLVNLGLVFKVNEQMSFYSSLNQASQAAQVGRIIRSIETGDELAKFNLEDQKPAVTDNFDIGFRFDNGKFTFDSSVFFTTSDYGTIMYKPTGSDLYTVQRGKVETDGFTLVSSYQLDPNTTLGASYSMVDGKYDFDDGDDSTPEGSLNSDLGGEQIGPNKLSAFIQRQFAENWVARLTALYYFDRSFEGTKWDNDNKEIDFKGYGLLHLNLKGKVGPGQVSLGVQNLLNEEYVTYYSQTEESQHTARYFAGRGRSLKLAYSLKF